VTTIAYDPLNRELTKTAANGVVTSHLYDAAGNESSRWQVNPAGAGLTAYTATYDAVGNKQSVAEIDGVRSDLPIAHGTALRARRRERDVRLRSAGQSPDDEPERRDN
jgi:YD repeat-containing protein